MKGSITRLIIILLCAVAYALPAWSWGQKGHRIIAKIAYDNLNCGTRKKVDKILGKGGIIYWANWADEIKSDTIYPDSYDWHFQDFNGGLSDSVVADALVHYPAEGGNLFKALDSLVKGQGTKDDGPWTRGMTKEVLLRFIVHLSGDRYCPMHMAHMDDKGGNTVRMAWFSKQPNTNLHAVWDTKLIDSQGYSYTEYAQKLECEYAWKKKVIRKMSDAELLVRTYHLTEAIYRYQDEWDGNTYHYIYHWRQPMEEQLYIAGIRLAQLLNRMY